jgi:hypothetical protein
LPASIATLCLSVPLSAALFLSLNAVCISGFEEQNEEGMVETHEKVIMEIINAGVRRDEQEDGCGE